MRPTLQNPTNSIWEESIRPATSQIVDQFADQFGLPDRPGDQIPGVPTNIDTLSDSSLMRLYAEMVSWLSYAQAELVKADIDEDFWATSLKLAEARTLIDQWGDGSKGDTVTLAKARRDVDPQVVDATQKHLNARAYRKLVGTLYERCERGAQIIFRELSRRIAHAPSEHRQQRFIP